jgi:hypothetical protein
MAKHKRTRSTSSEANRSGRNRNPGLPDPKTIVSERTFMSPKGRRHRIITTTDKDPYDPVDNDSRKDKADDI